MASKWNKSTLLQLKKALADRGIDSKGKRGDLIERLVEYEKQQEQEKEEEQSDEDIQPEEQDEEQVDEDAQPEESAETAVEVEEQPESMDTAETEETEKEADNETEKETEKETENGGGGDDDVIMVGASAEADNSEDSEDDDDDDDDDDEDKDKEDRKVTENSGTHSGSRKPRKWIAYQLLWRDRMQIERYKRILERENINVHKDVHPIKVSCENVDNRILLYPIEFDDFANTSFQEATNKALRVTTSTLPVASTETEADVPGKSFVNMLFKNETEVQEMLPLLENLKENIKIFHKSSEKETKLDEFIQGFHDLVGIEDLTKATLFTYLPPKGKVADLHKLYPMALQIKPHPKEKNAVFTYFSSEKEYNRQVAWLDENNPDPELRGIHSFILADILEPQMPDEDFQKAKRDRKNRAMQAYKAKTGRKKKPKKKKKEEDISVTRAPDYERGVEGKMPPKDPSLRHSSSRDLKRNRPSRFSDRDEVPRKRIDLGPSRGRRADVVNPYIADSVNESLQMIMGASARLQMAVAKGPTGPLQRDVVGRLGGMMGRSAALQRGVRPGAGGIQGGIRSQQGGMMGTQGAMLANQTHRRGLPGYDDEDSFVVTPSSFRVGYGGKQGVAAFRGTRVPDRELLRGRQGGAGARQGGAGARQGGAGMSKGGAQYTNKAVLDRYGNPIRVGGQAYKASRATDYDDYDEDDEALGLPHGKYW